MENDMSSDGEGSYQCKGEILHYYRLKVNRSQKATAGSSAAIFFIICIQLVEILKQSEVSSHGFISM